MKTYPSKRQLTPDEQAECLKLKAIFDSKKRELKLTQEIIGDVLEITQASVSNYMNGVNALNLPIAVKFAKILDVAVSDFSPRLAQQAAALVSMTAPKGLNDGDAAITDTLTGKNEQLLHNQMRIIPVKSAAQILCNDEQGEDQMVLLGEHGPNVFGYRLETDEMQGLRGKYIEMGSVLVIDPEATPKQADVVLAEVAGSLVVGHYATHAGVAKVRPSNDQYDAVDLGDGRILGVATQWTYAPGEHQR